MKQINITLPFGVKTEEEWEIEKGVKRMEDWLCLDSRISKNNNNNWKLKKEKQGKRKGKEIKNHAMTRERWSRNGKKKTSYIVFEGKMALSKIVSPLSYILLKF